MKNEPLETEFDERILVPAENEIVCPVYTTPRNEFRLRDFCRENNILCYLPLKKTLKINNYQSHGKPYRATKEVLRPMFSSYLFVKLAQGQQSRLWGSCAVVRFLMPEVQQRLLDDIRAVRAIELTGLEQELEFNVYIKEGDHFTIENGVWRGVSGWLKRKERRYLWIVELEFNNQLVRTEIDPSQLRLRPFA